MFFRKLIAKIFHVFSYEVDSLGSTKHTVSLGLNKSISVNYSF